GGGVAALVWRGGGGGAAARAGVGAAGGGEGGAGAWGCPPRHKEVGRGPATPAGDARLREGLAPPGTRAPTAANREYLIGWGYRAILGSPDRFPASLSGVGHGPWFRCAEEGCGPPLEWPHGNCCLLPHGRSPGAVGGLRVRPSPGSLQPQQCDRPRGRSERPGQERSREYPQGGRAQGQG